MESEDQEKEIKLCQEAYVDVGGVKSVNGYTGDVVLTTSDLENTSNYQNANDLSTAISNHNQSTSAHQDIRQAISDEANTRSNADNNLQGQIDAITSSSDVVDIVGTYAELQAYDTQHLQNNDVIKVLQDETHNDAMTYWRWNKETETWSYIGAEGPYYTKSETNNLLDEKLDADEVPEGFFDGPATFITSSGTTVEVEGGLKLKSTNLLGDSDQDGTPTPDSPVNIDVVTGTQTITVSDGDSATQTYTVDLGLIELCKIGTYQDYIYKSGSDWYIHKETNKVIFDGSEDWATGVSSNVRFFRHDTTDGAENSDQLVKVISDRFIGRYDTVSNSIVISGSIAGRILIFINDIAQNVTQWKAWLANNNVTCYYAIETPTNTKITDTTLINELNALNNMSLYNTTIFQSSGNLPAILKMEVFTEHLNSLLEIAAEPDTIVSGGTTYTAGSGIDITSDIISVDTTTIQSKLTAGANITIDQNNEISATDTTYNAFTGTDGVSAGTTGLVPAPATTDAGKFLKADGTWDTAGGGGVKELTTSDYNYPTNNPDRVALWLLPHGVYSKASSSVACAVTTSKYTAGVDLMYVGDGLRGSKVIFVYTSEKAEIYNVDSTGAEINYRNLLTGSIVQTTGNSQTDVMSQNAVTSMIYGTPASQKNIRIGSQSAATDSTAIALGSAAKAQSSYALAIGSGGSSSVSKGPVASGTQSMAFGLNASATERSAISFGGAATTQGVMNVAPQGSTNGYNSSNYRLITGVYDGQNANDAVTVGQVNSVIDAINTALSTNIPHIGA